MPVNTFHFFVCWHVLRKTHIVLLLCVFSDSVFSTRNTTSQARILDAMGDKKSDCDPCHQKEISEAPVAEVVPSEPQPAPEPLEAPQSEPQAEPQAEPQEPLVEAPVEAPPQAEAPPPPPEPCPEGEVCEQQAEAEPSAAPPVDTAVKSIPPANAMRSSTLALKR